MTSAWSYQATPHDAASQKKRIAWRFNDRHDESAEEIQDDSNGNSTRSAHNQ